MQVIQPLAQQLLQLLRAVFSFYASHTGDVFSEDETNLWDYWRVLV
jgi:hypothetical protein